MERPYSLGRRQFLTGLTLTAAATSAPSVFAAQKAPTKSLLGVVPIGWTPLKPGGAIDIDGIGAQAVFCGRTGVHGLAWPQFASGYAALSEADRKAGAEALVNGAKGTRTAIIIGVQSKDGNFAEIERYAKHAEKIGADAIICIPPKVNTSKEIVAFFKRLGKVTKLPLFAQAVDANFSVDVLVEMSETIPTFGYVKDEAGDPLQRVGEITKRTNGRLKSFAGRGVYVMMTEMERGFTGHCPVINLADLHAQAYDLFHAGKKAEAFDMFGRVLTAHSMFGMVSANALIARGVFKPGTTLLVVPPFGEGIADNPLNLVPPDEIKRILDTYLRPYLRT
jgi:dihydrodipicolinate synthase/N-acetylneuraminate lyase